MSCDDYKMQFMVDSVRYDEVCVKKICSINEASCSEKTKQSVKTSNEPNCYRIFCPYCGNKHTHKVDCSD